MVFGHRGINVPVIDHATGRVAVTAQNHGFALEGEAGERFDTPFGTAEVSHTCANDGVVEGIKLVDGRAFSVQYHPEAAAGPHDAEYLFDQFVDHTYVEPITPAFVERVIAQQAERGNKIDALLATLGGQTALNTAVALYENGALDRYGVELIGADFEAIQRGE